MTTTACRILLADDDRDVQRAVWRVATQHGHELIQVTVGGAVFASALLIKPDLIVLDVAFPDADGRDLLAQLKADPRTKKIPVLVWSGRQDRASESRIVLSLGAEDYVEKSDALTLMGKIERLLLRLNESGAERAVA